MNHKNRLRLRRAASRRRLVTGFFLALVALPHYAAGWCSNQVVTRLVLHLKRDYSNQRQRTCSLSQTPAAKLCGSDESGYHGDNKQDVDATRVTTHQSEDHRRSLVERIRAAYEKEETDGILKLASSLFRNPSDMPSPERLVHASSKAAEGRK